MSSNEGRHRILLVTPSLAGPGGVANYYRTLLPLLEKGKCPTDHLEIGSFKGQNNYFHPIHDQWRLHRSALSKVALVHLNPSLNLKSFVREGGFVLQAKRHTCRVLVFFHGWNGRFARVLERGMLPLFRVVYGQADAFIVLASEFEATLKSWGIRKPIYRETTVVDPALLETFTLKERMVRIRNLDTIRVLYLARLDRKKGIFETVEAIRLLRARNVPVQLSIAGEGPAKQALLDHIRNSQIPSDSITLLGYLRGAKKAAALKNHDVYCLPTYHEGMPIAVLEALAFGLPVVTCAVGGLKDIFEDGRMGRLVPVGNAQAVADGIQDIVKDKDAMARIAHTNEAFAAANLSAPRVAQRIQRLYQQTVTSNHF